jgi:hypothetical protein
MIISLVSGEEHDENQVREADGTVPGRASKRKMVVPVHRRCCYGFAPGNCSKITRALMINSIFFVGLNRFSVRIINDMLQLT